MFLFVDKPKGMTSHDVVDEVRIITGESKVGHAGTLDPNATGLLILGIGRPSTKKLGDVSKNTRKKYEAEIYLGEERDTDDTEGITISKAKGFLPPTESEIRLILATFLGKQKQIPPAHSAIKVKGKKAYQLARKGKALNLKPRKVQIYSIKFLSYQFPILKIETQVSSGTYIRSLARDIGKRVGCGAYLTELKRTQIGKHSIENSTTLAVLTKSDWKKLALKNI